MKIESAFYPGVMTEEIITHTRPDIDEAGCIWLGSRFGDELWPGFDFALSQKKVRLVEAGVRPVHEQHPDELERSGRIVFGTWGGRYDEHPYDGQPAKAKSAIDLVSARLEMAQRYPNLAKLISEISRADSEPTNGYLTLGRCIKAMHGLADKTPNDVISWATTALDALSYVEENPQQHEANNGLTTVQYLNRWANQRGFDRSDPFYKKMNWEISNAEKKGEYLSIHRVVRALQCMYSGDDKKVGSWTCDTFDALWVEYQAFQEALKAPHEKIEVKLSDGSNWPVVVIDGDYEMADKAMRYRYRHLSRLAFIIQRRSSGRTQILGSINPKTKLSDFDMPALAVLIRQAEAEARGIDTTGKDLSIDGMVGGLDIWYLFKQALLNGTPKNNKVEPTALSLKQVVEIVCSFLASQWFKPAA